MTNLFRAVAQLGRAPGSGPGGRGFKSHQPDKIIEAQTMFHCYVLSSEKTARGTVGLGGNMVDQVNRDNAGQSKATKHEVPWVLIRNESLASRSEAAQRERYYKTGGVPDELNNPR